MKYVLVSIVGYGREYVCKCDLDEELKKGDTVVVARNNFFSIGKISMEDAATFSNTNSYVVSCISTEQHEQRLKREEEKIELRKILTQKMIAFQKTTLIDLLCQSDPEAACIKAKLDELEK